VVIHDFDIFDAGVRPTETHTELIIDADAMLPRTISFQCFQSVSWRHPQIVQSARDLQLPQLTSRNDRNVREPLYLLALRKSLRVGALERLDHKLDSNA
jgi:hypothetical protein